MRWPVNWLLVATLVGCDAVPDERAPAGADDPGASRASYPIQLVDAGHERVDLHMENGPSWYRPEILWF